MKALQRARAAGARLGGRIRSGAARASRAAAAGPVAVWKGIRWAAAGVADAVRRATGGVRGAVRDGSARLWRRSGGAELLDRFRSSPRAAVAIAAGVILTCAWIGWTIYVTAENGTAAGLGVLITWPAVVLALAIVASPFVITAFLLRRRQGDGEEVPPIAGGAEVEGSEDAGSTTA